MRKNKGHQIIALDLSPVRNRASHNLGSVAGQDAIILAIYTGIIPRVATLECSLRSPSAERGILLTLGTPGSGNDLYGRCVVLYDRSVHYVLVILLHDAFVLEMKLMVGECLS